MEYAVLVLIALAIPVAGVAGFFMALKLRTRALALEMRVAAVEERLAAGQVQPERPAEAGETPAVDASGPPPVPEVAVPEEAGTAAASPVDEAAVPPSGDMPPPVQPQAPRAARPGLEERLGTRWAVWVGGVALALGGLLLVRYSIEQGYFGPGARIALAGLFSVALVAAGEWLRRRERGVAVAGIPSAHIPGIVTAAGTISAFATAYGAYALYGFIGPTVAFVLLGAIAVATMFAAALHGPALAGLGLVGALGNPLLVSTSDPRPWPLAIYLAVVVAAAYGLARIRVWRWLALAAAVGALLWGFLIVIAMGHNAMLPGLAYVAAQTALAGYFLGLSPHRGTPDEEAKPDWFAGGILAAFAVLAALATNLPADGSGRALFAGLLVALNLGLAIATAPVAVAGLLAAGIGGAALAFWPVARFIRGEEPSVLPGAGAAVPLPEAMTLYLAFGIVVAVAILAASFWRMARGRALPPVAAGLYALAATAGPAALLVIAYWRVTDFDRSISFAVAAGALAAVHVAAAGWLREQDDGTSFAVRLGVGAAACAAIGALALGLTFALDKGMLTVAFALAALGAAHVATRIDIPALRYGVAALGLLVLGRIIWDPAIAGADLGQTPIVNWLLWGYGVPAVAFALAAQLLARQGRDRVTQFCEGLAIAFAALLVFFEIRHATNGGDPFAPGVAHLEAGLLATSGMLFSLVMTRLDSARPDPVYRIASLGFAGWTLLVAVLGLGLAGNPLLTGDAIEGGAVFNSLLIAYLLPAMIAGVLAWDFRATRPRWFVLAAAGIGLFLQFLYTMMEIRRLFQGPVIDIDRATGEAELWTYSAVLIVIGVVALAIGLVRDIRLARLLSAAYIVAAVLKVFLVDLSSLEGALRAVSFIGLGLVLVGIGLAYQKLLVRRPAAGTGAAAGD